MEWFSEEAALWSAFLLAFFAVGVQGFRQWQKKELKRLDNASKAYDDHDRAFDLLEQWEKARPFLRVGQCPYAQSLVLEMIDAYERIMLYDPNSPGKEWWLQYLRGLLQDVPPPRTPPFASEPPQGLAFFLRWFSTRRILQNLAYRLY